MEQNYKEFKKRQLTKIWEGVQQARMKGRRVIVYLSGGDEYYFMSLKSIRRRSLFLAILWGCFSILFTLAAWRLAIIMDNLMNALENSVQDIPSYYYFEKLLGEITLVVIIILIIILFISSIYVYRLRLSPERLKAYLIFNTVFSALLAFFCFVSLFSGNFNDFGLVCIFGCIFVVAAFVSGIALTDINNYRDWFMGFGKKKSKARNNKAKENQSNMPKKEGSMRLVSDIVDLVNDVYDVDPNVFAGVYPYSKNIKIFKQMENKINSFNLKNYRDNVDERLYKMAIDFKKYLRGEIRTYIQQEELTNNILGMSSYQYSRETERLIKQMRKYEADYKETLRRMEEYCKKHYS